MTPKKSGSTGVLFFSFENEIIDYSALARYASQQVKRHLGLPVCVVTDNPKKHEYADECVLLKTDVATTRRYFKDYQTNALWYNMGRELAFDLTPWQHTVVLDADYLVMSQTLKAFADMELAMSRSASFVGLPDGKRELSSMPMTNMPMYWATVMIFDSMSPRAESFFWRMKKLKAAWPYYSVQAGLDPNLYRNDYVVTMALACIQGNRWARNHDLPVTLLTADEDTLITGLTDTSAQLERHGRLSHVKDIDLHVFNKRSLLASIGQL